MAGKSREQIAQNPWEISAELGADPTVEHILEHYYRRPSIMETFNYLQKGQGEQGFKPATAGQVAKAIGRSTVTARKALHELEEIGAITRLDCWRVHSCHNPSDFHIVVGDRPEEVEDYHAQYIHYAHVTHNFIIPVAGRK